MVAEIGIKHGDTFGRLTVWGVNSDRPSQKGYPFYICKCSCDGPDSITEVRGDNLVAGRTQSCGCLREKEVIADRLPRGFLSSNERFDKIENGRVYFYDLEIGAENGSECGSGCTFGRPIEGCDENHSLEELGLVRYSRELPKRHVDVQPGATFGRFTILSKADKPRYWNVRCEECGAEKAVRGDRFKSREPIGCVCDRLSCEQLEVKRIWSQIVQRCTNPNHKDYPTYSKRGIDPAFVSDFAAFYRELGPRPSKRHSVDRKNNSLGYLKGSIRWATPEEQEANKGTDPGFVDGFPDRTSEDWALLTLRRLNLRPTTRAGRTNRKLWKQSDVARIIRAFMVTVQQELSALRSTQAGSAK